MISCVRRCVSSIRFTDFISSACSRAIRLARSWRSASTFIRARLAPSIAADMSACCESSTRSALCVCAMAESDDASGEARSASL